MFTLAKFLEPLCVAQQSEAARDRLTELIAQCEEALHPQGLMEISFSAQILHGIWRLEHRTDLDEANRARVENSLRRNTAALSRLQTDRQLKTELDLDLPGLAIVKDVLKYGKRENAPKTDENEKRKYEPISENLKTVEADLRSQIDEEEQKQLAEYSKKRGRPVLSPQKYGPLSDSGRRTKIVPRNAPCPCGSRQKHKRCCGKDSPPVYSIAA